MTSSLPSIIIVLPVFLMENSEVLAERSIKLLSYIYHLGLQLLSLGAAGDSGCIIGSHSLCEDPGLLLLQTQGALVVTLASYLHQPRLGSLGGPITKLLVNFFSARCLMADPAILFSKDVKIAFCLKTCFDFKWFEKCILDCYLFPQTEEEKKKQICGKWFKSPLQWLVLNIFFPSLYCPTTENWSTY